MSITEPEIKKAIEKYSRFYAYIYKIPKAEAGSEIGYAIVKAMGGWAAIEETTVKFVTYMDRTIKNHMRNYKRNQAVYAYRMQQVPNIDRVEDVYRPMAEFDVLQAFSGRDYNIASEFINPSEKVVKIIQAIKSKFQSFDGDLGNERRLLKAGIDCFAISLVYDVGIRRVEDIKSRIYIEMKEK